MFHVDHTALSVSDMEKSITFYQKLGFEFYQNWEAEDDSLRIVMLKKDGTFLELFCYADSTKLPESARSVATDLRVRGTKHFALHTKNLEEAIDYLQKENLLEEAPEIKTGRLGRNYFFISDPDGIQVEIICEK